MTDSTTRSRFAPALLVLGAWVTLAGLTLLPVPVNGLPIRLKRLDLLADLRPQPLGRTPATAPAASVPGPFMPAAPPRQPRPIPALPDDGGEPIESAEPGALAGFYDVLSKTDGSPVRIGYMSDSIAEGDLITQDLRSDFQGAFGGSGAGFLPITSEVARFRSTVGHAFSPDWTTVTLMDRKRRFDVGIGGVAFAPGCRTAAGGTTTCAGWVEYSAISPRAGLRRFEGLRVYYSHAEAGATLASEWDGAPPATVTLEPGPDLHEIVVTPETPARKVRLSFAASAPLRVYGVAWDAPAGGVAVDDLPLRGHSGLGLADIPGGMLEAFDRLRHYDLVILHYGANVAAPEGTDISWFERGMGHTVSHLRNHLPSSSLLLVSVSDRSGKTGDDYATLPTIPLVVEAQRRVAAKGHAAFWNLFAMMGGEGSMVGWVQHDPPLAALDYTHFSIVGSRRVATALFRSLMTDLEKSRPRAH